MSAVKRVILITSDSGKSVWEIQGHELWSKQLYLIKNTPHSVSTLPSIGFLISVYFYKLSSDDSKTYSFNLIIKNYKLDPCSNR